MNTRRGNAPILRHLLAATTRNPGRVELAGIELVDFRWRPGEKAWLLAWD